MLSAIVRAVICGCSNGIAVIQIKEQTIIFGEVVQGWASPLRWREIKKFEVQKISCCSKNASTAR